MLVAMPSKSRIRRTVLALLVLAALAATFAARDFADRIRGFDRPLKIGFQTSPPYHFPDQDGKATGPAVDLIRAAAQRRNIRLNWVYSEGGHDKALSTGSVDLWPIVAQLPNRQSLLYTSK